MFAPLFSHIARMEWPLGPITNPAASKVTCTMPKMMVHYRIICMQGACGALQCYEQDTSPRAYAVELRSDTVTYWQSGLL